MAIEQINIDVTITIFYLLISKVSIQSSIALSSSSSYFALSLSCCQSSFFCITVHSVLLKLKQFCLLYLYFMSVYDLRFCPFRMAFKTASLLQTTQTHQNESQSAHCLLCSAVSRAQSNILKKFSNIVDLCVYCARYTYQQFSIFISDERMTLTHITHNLNEYSIIIKFHSSLFKRKSANWRAPSLDFLYFRKQGRRNARNQVRKQWSIGAV